MIELTCNRCGKSFRVIPSAIKRGRKYCSVMCSNIALKGRISPMKGKHHTEESRLKISQHNGRGGLGKRPPDKAIKTLTDYVKEHGPWNKKYDDPSEKFTNYRKNHKEEIKIRNKTHHKVFYTSWDGYASLAYRNLRSRHNDNLPYGLDKFRSWLNSQPKICYLCGEQLLLGGRRTQLDHVDPVVNGGKGDLDNLKLICKKCNEIKHGYTIDEVIETVKKWSDILAIKT